MKTPHSFLKCLAPVLVLLGGAAARAENATNAVAKIAPPALVRSVFVDDAKSGVDPFFPKSTRRAEVLEKTSPTNTPPQPGLLFQQLSLKGISGTKTQRLALINSATVSVGESAEIRCGIQMVKIRCLEIRDRSVLIALDGATEVKELKLREGI